MVVSIVQYMVVILDGLLAYSSIQFVCLVDVPPIQCSQHAIDFLKRLEKAIVDFTCPWYLALGGLSKH